MVIIFHEVSRNSRAIVANFVENIGCFGKLKIIGLDQDFLITTQGIFKRMSANPFNAPLTISIRPSLQKGLVIVIPHMLALGFVMLLNVFALGLKLILGGIILLSGVYYVRLHLFQTLKKSVKSIQQDTAKNWFITTYDESHESELKTVLLLPSSFMNKALIVLNYRAVYDDKEGANYSVIITPDSISSNKFRRLGVRLKLINIKNN